MEKNSVAIWPALTWLFLTTVLLCLPGSALPKETWFNKIWLDKWVHIGLFAVMVLLWCRVTINMQGKKIQYFLQIAFYFFLYGVIMEFIQKYFIPNRSFDAGDILADGVGSGIGLLLSMRLYKKNRPL